MRQSGNTDYMGSPDTHGESSGLKELKKQLKYVSYKGTLFSYLVDVIYWRGLPHSGRNGHS